MLPSLSELVVCVTSAVDFSTPLSPSVFVMPDDPSQWPTASSAPGDEQSLPPSPPPSVVAAAPVSSLSQSSRTACAAVTSLVEIRS